MSNEEILQKAIEKAQANGWSNAVIYYVQSESQIVTSFGGVSISLCYEQIIFNHEFAKALWPQPAPYEYRNDGTSRSISLSPAWIHHLQEMVIIDDPIKYLGEHL